MSAEFTSRLDEFRARHQTAIDRALTAAADVLKTAVMREHRGGYTSGTYSFGQVRNAIVASAPVTEDGVRVIRVGIRGTGTPYKHGQATPATIGQISLFWELGHFNIMAKKGGAEASSVGTKRKGRYIRVEKWRPATDKATNAIRAKFQTEYRGMMDRGGA